MFREHFIVSQPFYGFVFGVEVYVTALCLRLMFWTILGLLGGCSPTFYGFVACSVS